MDVGQLKIQLARRAESIARELLPNGRKQGSEWCVGSVEGEAGQSLKVHTSGDKAGKWADFEGHHHGDLIDLYAAVKGCDLGTAIRWAKDLLGISEPQFQRALEAKPYRKPAVKNVTVPKSAALDYLAARGIKPETVKTFQLGAQAARAFKTKNGEHTCPAIVFPFKADDELLFVKYIGIERPDGKKLIGVEAGCEAVLFGWQALPANDRQVIICEGEYNALSWFQMGRGALSTPFGAGKGSKHAWIANEWHRMERFETIFLQFDPDAAGHEAISDLVERLGRHRCRVVPPMPDGHKDANDCLLAGVAPERMQALLADARTQDPDELRSATDFTDQVLAIFNGRDESANGLPLPFKAVADKFHFRPSETTLVTGKRGTGKTEAVNQIAGHVMAAGKRVCIASFEMKAKRLLYRSVRQMTAQKQPSDRYISQVMNWYYDRLWIYDHVGSANQERVFEVFDYARRRYGIDFFVIDSLMKIGIAGQDSHALYVAQDAFADRFVNFNNQHNTHGILVAHSNKEGGEDVMPSNDGVKGSGGLTDHVHNVIGCWRNKAKEIALQKQMAGDEMSAAEVKALKHPDVIWVIDKQREGDGWIGRVNLGFDSESKQFVGDGEIVRPLLTFDSEGVLVAGDDGYHDYPPEF